MNPLEGLDPEELVKLSDVDFQERVRKHARAKTSDAMQVINEVMHESDDDQARLIAAAKMLKIAKAEEEEKTGVLPFGVSEEVFRIALTGLAQLASIASTNKPPEVLRDVTPARADPRPFIADDSPLNVKPKLPEDSYEAPGANIIEENVDVEE